MSKEDIILTYQKKKEDLPDHASHKFRVDMVLKKIQTYVYKAEGLEVFLRMLREF